MKRCHCDRDEDGQCPDCRLRITEAMKHLAITLKTFLEGMDRLKTEMDRSLAKLRENAEGLCNGCARRYTDLGISKMLAFLDGSEQPIAEAVYSSVLGNMRGRIRKRPLTDRAWAELCRKNGWSRRR